MFGRKLLKLQQIMVLTAITVVAFAVRVNNLSFQSLWRDEVDAIYFSTQSWDGLVQMFTTPGHNGPLYYLILRPWFAIFNTSEFALRLPSAFAGTLSVLLTYKVVKLLFPQTSNLAFISAALMAVNPYQIWYGQEGKMYAIVVLCTLLSTVCWLAAMKKGGARRWFLYWLFSTLCLYFHVFAVLIIPVHFIWFLFSFKQSRKRILGYAMALSGLTVPYLPIVWWKWEILTSSTYTAGYAFTPFTEMIQSLLLVHSRGVAPVSWRLGIALVIFLALVGLLSVVVENSAENSSAVFLSAKSNQGWIFLLTWLSLPILTMYIISLKIPLYVDRYLIWIGPAFIIFIGIGIEILGKNRARVLKPIVLFGLSIFWVQIIYHQQNQPIKADMKNATQFVDAQRSENSLLLFQIPHMHFSYRYYTSDFNSAPFENSTGRLTPWGRGPFTNENYQAEQFDNNMVSLTLGYDEVWVVRSEAYLWDERNYFEAWLESHGQIILEEEFPLVQVQQYSLQSP